VIHVRHHLTLSTAGLSGLAVRSWRDARSADRRWEATAPLRGVATERTSAHAGQGRASSGQCEPRCSRGASWAAITRHGIVSPRCSSPSRGAAPTTTPNQRPRISQPSTRTSAPVSSSRHSCHGSSGCTMPATAARWGRAPASRRAAISISARVRTLTTTAWAGATLDDHPGGETVLRREAARLGAQWLPAATVAQPYPATSSLAIPGQMAHPAPSAIARPPRELD
jgi:hypothetical protein